VDAAGKRRRSCRAGRGTSARTAQRRHGQHAGRHTGNGSKYPNYKGCSVQWIPLKTCEKRNCSCRTGRMGVFATSRAYSTPRGRRSASRADGPARANGTQNTPWQVHRASSVLAAAQQNAKQIGLFGNSRTNAHLLGRLFGQQSPNRIAFCSVMLFSSLGREPMHVPGADDR